MQNIQLSIIIVNFETPEYTLQSIRSIRQNPPLCGYEIILIDNGSKDNSLERIRTEAPDVVCIETGVNLGFARANNLGISNARGAFILLLNSDTKILNNCIDSMLNYLIAYPEVGAVGPKQLDGQGKLQLSWGHFPTFVREAFRKLVHYRLSINDLIVRDYLEEKYAGSTEVDWISGSCLMARKNVLAEAGLLDDYYFMYFEDIDLCRRIRDLGLKIHFNSDLNILHYGGVSAKKNIMRVLVEYRRSQIYFARKYYGLSGVAVLKALLFIKYSMYFVKSGLEYLTGKFIRHSVKESLARLSLSKKTIELVFGREPSPEGLGTSTIPAKTF